MSQSRHKVRADELLTQLGHAESRSKAKAMILAGDIRIGDRVIDRPAEPLSPDTTFNVAQPPRFVSRGGFKLEHALDAFSIDVADAVAADLGASTGGFTDCLLKRGASKVYAVDVGCGQLDYRLRQDSRVIVMERVNARYLDSLPEAIDIVTIDVSFISVEHMLPVAGRVLRSGGAVVALIKPQFEAGKGVVDRRGVVKDEQVRRDVVVRVIGIAQDEGLGLRGLGRSPVVGPAGNNEFLGFFEKGAQRSDPKRLLQVVFGA
ncbi:TlyA family RNA methyltransferase [soil metagenome]